MLRAFGALAVRVGRRGARRTGRGPPAPVPSDAIANTARAPKVEITARRRGLVIARFSE
jgi:hypothetical protein